jgi:hypothetical protein
LSVFVVITLPVGVAARGGREMLLTARHGAIGFAVAVDTRIRLQKHDLPRCATWACAG